MIYIAMLIEVNLFQMPAVPLPLLLYKYQSLFEVIITCLLHQYLEILNNTNMNIKYKIHNNMCIINNKYIKNCLYYFVNILPVYYLEAKTNYTLHKKIKYIRYLMSYDRNIPIGG